MSAVLEIFNRMLRLGEYAKAEEIYKATETIEMPPEIPSREPFRKGMERLLEVAKETRDLNETATSVVLSEFPPDKITKPEILNSLRGVIRMRNLRDRDALNIQLYKIKKGLTGSATSEFWHDLIRSFGGGDVHLDSALKIIEVMLKHAPGDMERSFTILRSGGLVDADNPDALGRLKKILEPYREKGGPFAKDALRMMELSLDLRAGKDVDVDAALSGVKHPVINRIAPRLRMRHHRITGDVEALRKVLKETPKEKLFERVLLADTIVAMRVAGMTEELDQAVKEAQSEVTRAFVDSWYSPELGSCGTALSLADSLGNPEGLIPPGWIEDCLGKIQNVRESLTVKVEHARLVDDWKTAAEASSKAIEQYPTYYFFYFIRGEALFEVGQKEKAAEALKVYTRYAKDEDHYPRAVEILKKISEG